MRLHFIFWEEIERQTNPERVLSESFGFLSKNLHAHRLTFGTQRILYAPFKRQIYCLLSSGSRTWSIINILEKKFKTPAIWWRCFLPCWWKPREVAVQLFTGRLNSNDCFSVKLPRTSSLSSQVPPAAPLPVNLDPWKKESLLAKKSTGKGCI